MPLLRVLFGLVGLVLLALLVFFGIFVGAAMLTAGLAWRLLHKRSVRAPRASDAIVDAEYRVVRKAELPTHAEPARKLSGLVFPGWTMNDARPNDVIPAAPVPRVAVRGGGSFPVRRIYCVGRNFADHAREMGATAPTSRAERGTPVFFMKPADAIVTGEAVPYPPATTDLHHEVELVVAVGHDAPAGVLPVEEAQALVFGYTVGLDLTRRDLQAAAKAKGLPWDTAKGFDHSAPIGELVPVADAGSLEPARARTAGQRPAAPARAAVGPDLGRAGDPARTVQAVRAACRRPGVHGHAAGVAALQPGDRFEATLEGIARLRGHIEG